jgi:signal transduction histidine kinase/putative methionine-R-sulfoxide reductase with GAF domain
MGAAGRDAEGNVTTLQGLVIDVTERERTSRRQRAAYELGQQLATLLDPNQLLSETVNRLSDAFGYYHAQIYLYDAALERLIMQEGLGQAGAIMKAGGHAIPLRAERSLVARAARSLEPVTANNVSLDPDHLPNPLLPETRSEVAVPLYHGQELIGVLDLQHNIIDYFNEDEIRTLSIIGNQLSTALANARLFGEIQLEAERRAMLYEFGQRLSETLDPNAIAGVVVENLAALIDVPEVTLFRYDSAENTLETLAAHGELGQTTIGTTVPLRSRPDIQRVIQRQEMEVITSAAEVTDPAYDPPKRLGLTAWMAMPIAVADQVIGVMSVGEVRGARDFTNDEILLAQNVAFQVSISLQNAYLYYEQVQITERLREVDRLKSEFLASMSHELRTPLNSIIGYAEVLLDGIDGELTGEMEEDITAIHGSGKHLLNLINDILDLAKIEAGQMDLITEPVVLKPFVEELLATTSRVLIMGKPVEMVTRISEDLPPVMADPLRLRQIISNLVTNAIKFTEQGSITVYAQCYETDPAMIQVSVIDTGIGITAENLPKIFDRFRQVDQSATRRVGGTGLGLSITRQLVQMHGGDMWVESEYGKGSTFCFTLPTTKPEA